MSDKRYVGEEWARVIAPSQVSPLQRAIRSLMAAGATVEPADIPGLYNVNGRELTTGQVIDFASKV